MPCQTVGMPPGTESYEIALVGYARVGHATIFLDQIADDSNRVYAIPGKSVRHDLRVKLATAFESV